MLAFLESISFADFVQNQGDSLILGKKNSDFALILSDFVKVSNCLDLLHNPEKIKEHLYICVVHIVMTAWMSSIQTFYKNCETTIWVQRNDSIEVCSDHAALNSNLGIKIAFYFLSFAFVFAQPTFRVKDCNLIFQYVFNLNSIQEPRCVESTTIIMSNVQLHQFSQINRLNWKLIHLFQTNLLNVKDV